jgi:hypothetical protein
VPRSLRFFLIWLSCTALTVTAVSLTVGFVLGSTAPLPPTARAVSTVFATATASPTPDPTASTTIGSPLSTPDASPTHSQRATPAPGSSTHPPSRQTAPPVGHNTSSGCTGGAGTYTVDSVGGQVTVRFGDNAVCLVSAVPALGFTTSTSQSAPDTLLVVFTGARHRSELTATVTPQAQESTKEISW